MMRLLTAAVLLPILWLTLKKAPPEAFYALVLVVLVLAAWEAYALLAARGARPSRAVGLAGCLAVALSYVYAPLGHATGLALFLTVFGAASVAMWRQSQPPAMLDTLWSTLLPVVFIGLPFGCTLGLRALPGEDGTDPILLLLLCVMAADTAAYYVGSLAGRHKMAPILSPKKSWEGAAGGLLAGIGGGLVAHYWFYQRLPLRDALLLGLLLAAAGIVGDLAESMLKRAAGAKDSARILPGHGGFLDRTDSLLFAAPLLYYYAVYVMRLET